MANLPAATAKPEIVRVSDLLDSVMAGEVRIPRFQRPYIWTPEDMLELFDSVLHAYPIGSLLIWQTERDDISSLNEIGPLKLPERTTGLKSYVVDGHQRLATLLGVLRIPDTYPRLKAENWRWWIVYDLRTGNFLHLRDGGGPIPLHLLPLRSALGTVDFARRTREIASAIEFDEAEATLLMEKADSVHRALRDYQIPLIVMKSASLDEAVTIFSRVNQRGRDMTPDQMVSALTFRDRKEGDFDLAAAIDDILGNLRGFGYGDLERRTVLQIILALSGLDFTRPSYERIVDRNSHTRMREAVKRSATALQTTAEFMTGTLHLKTSRLLPYAAQVVMASIYFDELAQSRKPFGARENEQLTRWFWATSFNGWFAGANTTDVRKAGEQLRSFARDVDAGKAEFEKFFFDRPIRPFPETYDRRSARVRVSLLVQIVAGQPRDLESGEEIDGAAVFADEATRDVPYFFPNRKRPAVSNPANRVILPIGYPRNARGSFLKLELSPKRLEILKSHCITDEAFDFLLRDEFEGFIRCREEAILKLENAFLSQFGLAIDLDAERSGDELDARE